MEGADPRRKASALKNDDKPTPGRLQKKMRQLKRDAEDRSLGDLINEIGRLKMNSRHKKHGEPPYCRKRKRARLICSIHAGVTRRNTSDNHQRRRKKKMQGGDAVVNGQAAALSHSQLLKRGKKNWSKVSGPVHG